jgi:hypothetical protein
MEDTVLNKKIIIVELVLRLSKLIWKNIPGEKVNIVGCVDDFFMILLYEKIMCCVIGKIVKSLKWCFFVTGVIKQKPFEEADLSVESSFNIFLTTCFERTINCLEKDWCSYLML